MSRVAALDPVTRAIVRANGAPKGQRRARQHELVRLVSDELRRQLGLRGKRLCRKRAR